MDVFAGSGATIAVAEKMSRRWIGCDIGKLSVYTMQKRLLTIQNSKLLANPKKKYGKASSSFAVVTSGLYDLGKVFALKKNDYINFVKQLFEVEDISNKSIGGLAIDGKKREFYVKIFPYWELEDVSVDEIEMIVLPGGWGGTHALADDTSVQKLLQEMDAKGKKIGAICAAPFALHKAGVLKHNYTCYPSVENEIRHEGYKGESAMVVEDANVMTSRGPATAICFALAIVKKLKGHESYNTLKSGLLAAYC